MHVVHSIGGKVARPRGAGPKRWLGVGGFVGVVGCAWRGAGFDVAVFAGFGEGDAEYQDAEEGLGENVAD